MKVNNEVKINKFNIFFNEINEITEKNYISIQGNFNVYDENKNIISNLNTEKRFYTIKKIFTTEAS